MRPAMTRAMRRTMTRAMRKASLAAMVLAGAAMLAVPGFAADETFDRVLPLPPGGSLVLANVTGTVNIVGWDRDAVEVHAVKTAKLQADLTRVGIDAAENAGRVAVKTVYHADENVEVTVNYTVRVPRRVWLEQVATVNGAVHVSGVEGAGELRSVNGNVEVADSSGGFSAHTVNGDIQMDLSRLASSVPLVLQTVNGSIGLAVPATTSAALDVNSLKGNFHSDIAMSLKGAYSPREFHGQLGGGGTPVQLRTVNGAIHIQALAPGV
jgi:DUF4097 and DUF4098 domain-containing protein YvlB